jgi:spermidine dehydrogenase
MAQPGASGGLAGASKTKSKSNSTATTRVTHPPGLCVTYPPDRSELRFPADPAEPMLVHLAKVVVPGDGRDARTQAAAGRQLLQGWSFEFLEGEVRRVLQGALGGFGFDAARDIEAITVNRWAHGYTYEYMRPWDRFWPHGPLPNLAARRGWGRVAIAGSDSAANAYAHAAIDEATRAVQELLPQARLPAWNAFPGPDPKAIGL